MKLTGRRESSNVDDRRGMSTAGIGGIGIGGVIVAALMVRAPELVEGWA